MAGILGPLLVNFMNQRQVIAGVPRAWGLWTTVRQAAVLFG